MIPVSTDMVSSLSDGTSDAFIDDGCSYASLDNAPRSFGSIAS
jgi:hypothetical protein